MKFNIFELGIFSFNSYVYYLTRGFIASTRAFNLLTRAFNLPTRAFSLLTRGFELVTRGFELVTREFELVTREFELTTRGFELVTRNSCFNFPLLEDFFHGRKSIYYSTTRQTGQTHSHWKCRLLVLYYLKWALSTLPHTLSCFLLLIQKTSFPSIL